MGIMDDKVVFVDLEVGVHDRRIHDIGAVRADGATFHSGDVSAFRQFLGDARVLCGHNIVHHDMQYLAPALGNRTFALVDTLYWSPLLFPERPYHALLKDDKLLRDGLNNPVSDVLGRSLNGRAGLLIKISQVRLCQFYSLCRLSLRRTKD